MIQNCKAGTLRVWERLKSSIFLLVLLKPEVQSLFWLGGVTSCRSSQLHPFCSIIRNTQNNLEIRVHHICSGSVINSKLKKIFSLPGRTQQGWNWAIHNLTSFLKKFGGLKASFLLQILFWRTKLFLSPFRDFSTASNSCSKVFAFQSSFLFPSLIFDWRYGAVIL